MPNKKKVTFIATRQKNKKINVNFFTKEGRLVSFDTVKKSPQKERVEFFVTR